MVLFKNCGRFRDKYFASHQLSGSLPGNVPSLQHVRCCRHQWLYLTVQCTLWAGDAGIWEQGRSRGHVLFCCTTHFPWLHRPVSTWQTGGWWGTRDGLSSTWAPIRILKCFQVLLILGNHFFSLISVGANKELWDHPVCFCQLELEAAVPLYSGSYNLRRTNLTGMRAFVSEPFSETIAVTNELQPPHCTVGTLRHRWVQGFAQTPGGQRFGWEQTWDLSDKLGGTMWGTTWGTMDPLGVSHLSLPFFPLKKGVK